MAFSCFHPLRPKRFSDCLDPAKKANAFGLAFLFYFIFLMHSCLGRRQSYYSRTQSYYSRTVYALFMGLTTTLFRKKIIIKMGLMTLFTHLKIIYYNVFNF